MPITKERLKGLIDAADAYEQAWLALRATGDAMLNAPGERSPDFAALYAAIALAAPASAAQVTIAVERERYALTYQRNERHRLRMRRKRRGAKAPDEALRFADDETCEDAALGFANASNEEETPL